MGKSKQLYSSLEAHIYATFELHFGSSYLFGSLPEVHF